MALSWFNNTIILDEKSSSFRKGFWLTLGLSALLLYVFYGRLLADTNHVYFSKSGDGLQSYFGTLYQVKHDSTYWRMSGMNYPYGENSFLTGNQPLLTASIKLIGNTLIDISNYSVAIINLAMLLSIIACSLSIYSIFKHLHLPWGYSALAAIGITFLSPQIQRMGGHYSLAYPFAIPLFILLLLRFYECPTIKRTAAITVLTFVMAATHLYFFGIFLLMLSVFYLICIIRNENKFRNILFSIRHFSLQIILPFFIIWPLLNLGEPVNDRPQTPWGFLVYRSVWQGIFLPLGRPLGTIINSFYEIPHVEWEGVTYVGIAATLFTIVLFFLFLKLLVKLEIGKIINITGNPSISGVFWSSIIGLIYSFGIPFIFNLEFLLDYMGILKQMRGIARFSWIFFYAINIIAFYLLYNWAATKMKTAKYVFLALPLALLFYDGWYSVKAKVHFLNNKINKLNRSDEEYQKLLESIDRNKYQAIIPLPYFAVGSENVWISTEDEQVRETLILSLTTGIPTMGSLLARTSLSQTYKHMQMIQEPYRELEIIHDIKDNRPFLILTREQLLSETEKQFLKKCSFFAATDDFTLYEVSFEVIKNYYKEAYGLVKSKAEQVILFSTSDLKSSDSIVNYFYNDFEEFKAQETYNGKGAFKGKLKDHNKFYDHPVPGSRSGEDYVISFWFYGFKHDLYPRTTMELTFVDTIQNQSKGGYKGLNQCMKVIDNDWTLVEFFFQMPVNYHKLQFTIWNAEINKEATFYADDFMIRPVKVNLYKFNGDTIFKNNRYYFPTP